VPWRINPIFLERLAVSSTPGKFPTNPGLFETFVRYQKR